MTQRSCLLHFQALFYESAVALDNQFGAKLHHIVRDMIAVPKCNRLLVVCSHQQIAHFMKNKDNTYNTWLFSCKYKTNI